MIHGPVNESANVFDLEALELLSAYAERNATSGPIEAVPAAVPAAVASASPASGPEKRPSVLRLAAFTSLFFLFGALGPIVNAVRARAVEGLPAASANAR